VDLIRRYVQAVGKYLPKGQRDDIVQELSANILSQFEDKEAELGRPLNEAERETIIKQHGNPAFVAAGFRQDQRTLAFGQVLIGPAVFPFYAVVLSLNLGLTAVVCVVITIAFGKPFLATVPAILTHLLVQFGIVTLIFTVAHKHLVSFPDRWDPRNPLAAPPVLEDEQ
jgi:hypothetical protein